MERAILLGPCVGELYWEAARFAPLLNTLREKHKNVKFIVLTRPDRFDLYGRNADFLVSLKIDGDYKVYKPDCFRLIGFGEIEFNRMVKQFNTEYSKRFQILNHYYPLVDKRSFSKRNQFSFEKRHYKYFPRDENYKIVDEYIPNNKPIVVLASRFRKGFRRNWHEWQNFYDLLWNEKDLVEKFTFVICGKVGEYSPDIKDRYFDINKLKITTSSSLIGVLLVILEKAFYTFGSQSAIPNLSLLYGVDVFEFGCQKELHSRTYNIFNTNIMYFDNPKYDFKAEKAVQIFRKLLERKENKKNE
jgi:hypothetical protein